MAKEKIHPVTIPIPVTIYNRLVKDGRKDRKKAGVVSLDIIISHYDMRDSLNRMEKIKEKKK
jgi:hypothetical protein